MNIENKLTAFKIPKRPSSSAENGVSDGDAPPPTKHIKIEAMEGKVSYLQFNLFTPRNIMIFFPLK